MTVLSPIELYREGYRLLEAGEMAAAAGQFRRLLTIVPDLGDALLYLGLIARRDGRTGDGEILMRRALCVSPLLALVHANLGYLYENDGEVELAEAHWRRLFVIEPANTVARRRLSVLLLGRGAVEEAEVLLRRLRDGGDGDIHTLPALRRCADYRRVRRAVGDSGLRRGLVVRGAFRDGSGYAYQTRQFVRHLVAAGVPVHLVDLNYQPVRNLDDSQIDPLFLSLDRPVRARGILHFTTPQAVDRLPGFKTVNYSLIETTRIQRRWVEHSRRHDRVIVATRSSADAWTASGCPADLVAVCPEGVEAVAPEAVHPVVVQGADGRQLGDYPVRFLNVSDFTPRKNLAGLLRVWFRATRRGDDAILVLKVGKDPSSRAEFAALCREVSAGLGIGADQVAPLFVVDSLLSDAAMLSLYAAGTHYWSMSHGEGWDLAMTQAGAMGLTLLAPYHSAYTDYLDDRVAHSIPAAITPAGGAYAGFDWWTPDEEAAVDLVRRIVRSPEEHRRSAREHLLEGFGWDRAARRLIGLLEGCGAL